MREREGERENKPSKKKKQIEGKKRKKKKEDKIKERDTCQNVTALGQKKKVNEMIVAKLTEFLSKSGESSWA